MAFTAGGELASSGGDSSVDITHHCTLEQIKNRVVVVFDGEVPEGLLSISAEDGRFYVKRLYIRGAESCLKPLFCQSIS